MNTHDSQRRTVLRGTLAAGVTLLLGACDAKQESPAPMSATPPAAPPSPAPAGVAEPAPGAKLSKAHAQYQDQPKGEQKCARCLHFVAESNSCKVVEGDISPDGWCMLWVVAPA